MGQHLRLGNFVNWFVSPWKHRAESIDGHVIQHATVHLELPLMLLMGHETLAFKEGFQSQLRNVMGRVGPRVSLPGRGHFNPFVGVYRDNDEVECKSTAAVYCRIFHLRVLVSSDAQVYAITKRNEILQNIPPASLDKRESAITPTSVP